MVMSYLNTALLSGSNVTLVNFGAATQIGDISAVPSQGLFVVGELRVYANAGDDTGASISASSKGDLDIKAESVSVNGNLLVPSLANVVFADSGLDLQQQVQAISDTLVSREGGSGSNITITNLTANGTLHFDADAFISNLTATGNLDIRGTTHLGSLTSQGNASISGNIECGPLSCTSLTCGPIISGNLQTGNITCSNITAGNLQANLLQVGDTTAQTIISQAASLGPLVCTSITTANLQCSNLFSEGSADMTDLFVRGNMQCNDISANSLQLTNCDVAQGITANRIDADDLYCTIVRASTLETDLLLVQSSVTAHALVSTGPTLLGNITVTGDATIGGGAADNLVVTGNAVFLNPASFATFDVNTLDSNVITTSDLEARDARVESLISKDLVAQVLEASSLTANTCSLGSGSISDLHVANLTVTGDTVFTQAIQAAALDVTSLESTAIKFAQLEYITTGEAIQVGQFTDPVDIRLRTGSAAALMRVLPSGLASIIESTHSTYGVRGGTSLFVLPPSGITSLSIMYTGSRGSSQLVDLVTYGEAQALTEDRTSSNLRSFAANLELASTGSLTVTGDSFFAGNVVIEQDLDIRGVLNVQGLWRRYLLPTSQTIQAGFFEAGTTVQLRVETSLGAGFAIVIMGDPAAALLHSTFPLKVKTQGSGLFLEANSATDWDIQVLSSSTDPDDPAPAQTLQRTPAVTNAFGTELASLSGGLVVEGNSTLGNLTASGIQASHANLVQLVSSFANIASVECNQLEAANITATSITAQVVDAQVIDAQTLEAHSCQFSSLEGNLTGHSADLTYLQATVAHLNSVTTDSLQSNSVTTGNLQSVSANLGRLTATDALVTSIIADTLQANTMSTLGAQLGNLSVIDDLVCSGNIYANQADFLEMSSIDASFVSVQANSITANVVNSDLSANTATLTQLITTDLLVSNLAVMDTVIANGRLIEGFDGIFRNDAFIEGNAHIQGTLVVSFVESEDSIIGNASATTLVVNSLLASDVSAASASLGELRASNLVLPPDTRVDFGNSSLVFGQAVELTLGTSTTLISQELLHTTANLITGDANLRHGTFDQINAADATFGGLVADSVVCEDQLTAGPSTFQTMSAEAVLVASSVHAAEVVANAIVANTLSGNFASFHTLEVQSLQAELLAADEFAANSLILGSLDSNVITATSLVCESLAAVDADFTGLVTVNQVLINGTPPDFSGQLVGNLDVPGVSNVGNLNVTGHIEAQSLTVNSLFTSEVGVSIPGVLELKPDHQILFEEDDLIFRVQGVDRIFIDGNSAVFNTGISAQGNLAVAGNITADSLQCSSVGATTLTASHLQAPSANIGHLHSASISADTLRATANAVMANVLVEGNLTASSLLVEGNATVGSLFVQDSLVLPTGAIVANTSAGSIEFSVGGNPVTFFPDRTLVQGDITVGNLQATDLESDSANLGNLVVGSLTILGAVEFTTLGYQDIVVSGEVVANSVVVTGDLAADQVVCDIVAGIVQTDNISIEVLDLQSASVGNLLVQGDAIFGNVQANLITTLALETNIILMGNHAIRSEQGRVEVDIDGSTILSVSDELVDISGNLLAGNIEVSALFVDGVSVTGVPSQAQLESFTVGSQSVGVKLISSVFLPDEYIVLATPSSEVSLWVDAKQAGSFEVHTGNLVTQAPEDAGFDFLVYVPEVGVVLSGVVIA